VRPHVPRCTRRVDTGAHQTRDSILICGAVTWLVCEHVLERNLCAPGSDEKSHTRARAMKQTMHKRSREQR
jgi:hypothetical protein